MMQNWEIGKQREQIWLKMELKPQVDDSMKYKK